MIQKPRKNILITGTHLTPALELIRQLQNDSKTNWQIHYIGRHSNSNDSNNTSIESQIIPNLGVNFYPIYCGKFDRRFLPNTIAGIPKSIFGFFQALFLINKIKPNIVISFGGYVSVPVIINARLKNIISITHEQTLTNSLTTKINSLFVNKIALSFDNSNQIKQLNKNKVVIIGNLLRYQLFNKNPIKPNSKFSNKQPIIYITAGNQGSHSLNLVIKKILPILKNFSVIHQSGKNDLNLFKKLSNKYSYYFVSDYFNTDELTWIIHSTDILISRSGANTSQEIVAFNKKSILIPLPKSQQNEQLLNALWVKEKLPTKTIIIPQEKLNQRSLLSAIGTLIKVKSNLKTKEYKPNLQLLKLIYEII
ncbi:MAG: glycosyltransferase [Candidatus Shapirobacteria bacterium]|jgi:UDP-N-acetylglucosamine--N-acetylmuramyl-(pentapeptide) pyrophosphoryl-undecaprenol N-acetylglucosamine transferase